MSKIEGGTLRERMARLEVLMCNHLKHHEETEKKHDYNRKWIMGIAALVIAELVVEILPELFKLFG